jgi:hypothetical protein
MSRSNTGAPSGVTPLHGSHPETTRRNVRETGKSMKAGELAAPQKQRVAIGWLPLLTLVFQARTHEWDA